MQCKPVTSLSASEKWTFEMKFDGYRCVAVKRAKDVMLFSRHQKVPGNSSKRKTPCENRHPHGHSAGNP
jgi:hypothetical protein